MISAFPAFSRKLNSQGGVPQTHLGAYTPMGASAPKPGTELPSSSAPQWPSAASGLMQHLPKQSLHFGKAVTRASFLDLLKAKTNGVISQFSPFQQQAIDHLIAGDHIVVSAPTGSGKTLPAEFAIYDVIQRQPDGPAQLFYTTPTKALSNDKVKELRARFGAGNVGIMTGDFTDNPNAPVIVMTTEVLRNMLYQGTVENPAPQVNRVKYVVFDECHFISNPDRGTVWEECIMGLPPSVQQIHLSATISNGETYTKWVESLLNERKGRPIHYISETKRPVPLYSRMLDPYQGELMPVFDEEYFAAHPDRWEESLSHEFFRFVSDYEGELEGAQSGRRGKAKGNKGKKSKQVQGKGKPKHKEYSDWTFDPIRTISVLKSTRGHDGQNLLPAIVFAFSRKECNNFALREGGDSMADTPRWAPQNLRDTLHGDWAKQNLTTKGERIQIEDKINAYKKAFPQLESPEFTDIFKAMIAGVAPHHSGNLPIVNRLIEDLMKDKLLKVIFATDTLAYGINVPVKSVVISSYTRNIDGNVVPLDRASFLQLTGRAGRRGLDTEGYLILTPPHKAKDEDAPTIDIMDYVNPAPEPLNSQYQINPSLVLNLLDDMSLDEARHRVRRTFGSFMEHGAHVNGATRLSRALDAQVKWVKELGLLDDKLKPTTPMGQLVKAIPHEEGLLIAQAIQKGLLKGLSPADLAAYFSIFNGRHELEFTTEAQAKTTSTLRNLMMAPNEPGTQVRLPLEKAIAETGKLWMALHQPALKNVPPEELILMNGSVRHDVRNWCQKGDFTTITGNNYPGDVLRSIRRTDNLLAHLSADVLSPVLGADTRSLAEAMAQARKLLNQSPLPEMVRGWDDLPDA